MIKYLLLLAPVLLCLNLHAQHTLFFSEYIEGTSGNNKALEIFNPTTAPVDLGADQYLVQLYYNGASAPGNSIPLAGILYPGKTYVLTHTLFALRDTASHTINQKSSALTFNGDDAVVLRKSGIDGEIVDVIGQIENKPWEAWASGPVSTKDRTIIRKPEVVKGDGIGNDFFNPSAEWYLSGTDKAENLGVHSNITIPYLIVPARRAMSSRAAGIPSFSRRFALISNDTISRIVVSAPAYFQVSADSLGPFASRFDTSFPGELAANRHFFVRYVPHNSTPQSGTVNIIVEPDHDTIGLDVSGKIVSEGRIPISAVQGSGSETPFKGVRVAINGVITKDLQKSTEQRGFFVQDPVGDSSELTSEGIFVVDSTVAIDVSVGNIIYLEGIADEMFGQTVIRNIGSIVVTKASDPLPEPVFINLPQDSALGFERYEGMLVKFNQRLAVTDVYNLGRYGEVLLSPQKPFITPTNFIDPNDDPAIGTNTDGSSNTDAIRRQLSLYNRSSIILTDDLNTENPDPVPFIDSITKTLRVGSTIDTLTGVLSFGYNSWRLYTVNSPNIQYDTRPVAPPSSGNANIKTGAMNVLNFFNGDGRGGGFPTARGAKNLIEFRRQKSKIVAAIKGLDADVLGLMEVENDGDSTLSAIKELVDSLNATQSFADRYDYIRETAAEGNPGSDQIKVALIYKPSVVSTLGPARFCNSVSFEKLGRPPLAQTFTLNSNGAKLTVIVNHFKSKSCTGGLGADRDQDDGQSCFNETRKKQATELLAFVDDIISLQDSSVVVLGDFNAYNEEDPLDLLRNGGLISLIPNSYSYVFNGLKGSLDHAFATRSLAEKLTAAGKWHINSPEPRFIDYTTAFKTQDLFRPDPYRSSDHDPLLAGFHLDAPDVTGLMERVSVKMSDAFPNPVMKGQTLFVSDPNGVLFDAIGNVAASSEGYEIKTSFLSPGTYIYRSTEGKTQIIVLLP